LIRLFLGLGMDILVSRYLLKQAITRASKPRMGDNAAAQCRRGKSTRLSWEQRGLLRGSPRSFEVAYSGRRFLF